VDLHQVALASAADTSNQSTRRAAIKLIGDPNNPVHFKDDAMVGELRAEIQRRLNILQEACILELTLSPAPEVQ
jgi:hypothetical protein